MANNSLGHFIQKPQITLNNFNSCLMIPEMEWLTLLPRSENGNSVKPLALEDVNLYFSVAGKFPWSSLRSSLLSKRKKELFFPRIIWNSKKLPRKMEVSNSVLCFAIPLT